MHREIGNERNNHDADCQVQQPRLVSLGKTRASQAFGAQRQLVLQVTVVSDLGKRRFLVGSSEAHGGLTCSPNLNLRVKRC